MGIKLRKVVPTYPSAMTTPSIYTSLTGSVYPVSVKGVAICDIDPTIPHRASVL